MQFGRALRYSTDFLILKPELDTFKYICIIKIKKNEFIGIHEFFSGFPRSNTAITKEFTTLLKMKRSDLMKILRKDPEELVKS